MEGETGLEIGYRVSGIGYRGSGIRRRVSGMGYRVSGRGAVLLLVISAAASAQTTQSEPRPPGGVAVAAQISTGILGSATGFVAGGLITRRVARWRHANDDLASHLAYAGAYTGATLATAVGPWAIASRGDVKAPYVAAVAGAFAGGLGSVILRKIGRTGIFGEHGPVALLAGAAIIALPSIGATISVNSRRTR
jgi:hypothetical protein